MDARMGVITWCDHMGWKGLVGKGTEALEGLVYKGTQALEGLVGKGT